MSAPERRDPWEGPDSPTPPRSNPRFEFWGRPSGVQGWPPPVYSDGGLLSVSVHPASWHIYMLRCMADEEAKVSFALECNSEGIGNWGPEKDWKCPNIEDIAQSQHIKRIRVNLVGPHSRFFKLEYRATVTVYNAGWARHDTGWKRQGEWCGSTDSYNHWISELQFKLQRRTVN